MALPSRTIGAATYSVQPSTSAKACRARASPLAQCTCWARRRRMISPSTRGYSRATTDSFSRSKTLPPGWIDSATSVPTVMLVSRTRSKARADAASAGLWLRSSLGGPSSASPTRTPAMSMGWATSTAMPDLEEVGDEDVLVADVQCVAIAELLDVGEVLAVGADLVGQILQLPGDHLTVHAGSGDQVERPFARQQRGHGQVRGAFGREGTGKLGDDLVEEPAPPVVGGAVRGQLGQRVGRRLREVGDDDLVALGRDPGVDVGDIAADAIGHAVAKRVVEHVGHRVLVEVDRVHVRGAVECKLHGLQAGAAADVQAALMGADALLEEVLPQQVAARNSQGDTGVAGELGKRERKQSPAAPVAPVRAHGRCRSPVVA